jgi:uncharacterized protein (TIGR02118 family)
MFKATIMYPPTPSARFDMAYYIEKHMPMVKNKIGASCVGFTVEAGLAGGAPGSTAPYVAIGALLFESMEDFGAAMAEHGAEIMADIANYTDSQPVMQISEVKFG